MKWKQDLIRGIQPVYCRGCGRKLHSQKSREQIDIFVVAKHPELMAQVEDFVRGKRYVSTKHLRKRFGISGYLASVILRRLGYEKFSKVNSGTSYHRSESE